MRSSMKGYPFYGSKEAWAAKWKEMRNARLKKWGLERKFYLTGKRTKEYLGNQAYRRIVMTAIVRSMAPGVEDPPKVFRDIIAAELERLQTKLAGPITPKVRTGGDYARKRELGL